MRLAAENSADTQTHTVLVAIGNYNYTVVGWFCMLQPKPLCCNPNDDIALSIEQLGLHSNSNNASTPMCWA